MKIWYLQWRHVNKRERHREFPLAKSFFTIGRSPDNDLQLDDASISRVHAILRKHPDGVLVEDADSVNGVVIDGKPLPRALVKPGESFDLGDFQFAVVKHSMNQETQRREVVVPVAAVAEDEADSEDAAQTVQAPLVEEAEVPETPLNGPHLAELDAVGNLERRIELKGSHLRVGRSKQCDIRLTDRRVSRHHADLYFEHEQWRLVDQGSGNGIALPKGKVAELLLEPGMRFCLGGTWFVYLDGDESEADTLVRDIPKWVDETTGDLVLADIEEALGKPAADEFGTVRSADVAVGAATVRSGDVAVGGATVRSGDVAVGAATVRSADVARQDDGGSRSGLSQEEFLKEGEPCHACAKKLTEGAAYCGNCGVPTLHGVARQQRRRERGLWALLLAWVCLGGGLLFWAWGFPGATQLTAASGLPFGYVIGGVFALLAFVYHAAIMHRLAYQMDLHLGGLEWLPVLNVLALTKLAHLRNRWAILLLLPGVQVAVYTFVWWRVAYYRRKPRWLSLLVLIPVFGLFVPLFLAQEAEPVTDETMRNSCSNCGAQAKRHDRFCGGCGYPRA